MLAQLAVTHKLWTGDHVFPQVPAIEGLPELSRPWTFWLLGLFIAAIIASAVVPRVKALPWTVVIVGATLALFDIDRLQPWFYEYLLLFAVLAATPKDRTVPVAAIVLAGTYFWSGLQKANAMFATVVFPWLLGPFPKLQPLWPTVPLVETSMAILLLIPKTRQLGWLMAVGVHAFLLIALGPLGHSYNQAIWPWNLSLIALATVVYFNNREPLMKTAIGTVQGKIALAVAGIAPALNFAGYWDEYLSASLYSGRAQTAFVVLSQSGRAQAPADVQPFIIVSKRGYISLNLARWALDEMNVPAYPEVRVYRAVAEKLHSEGIDIDDMRLFVDKKPGLFDSKEEWQEVKID